MVVWVCFLFGNSLIIAKTIRWLWFWSLLPLPSLQFYFVWFLGTALLTSFISIFLSVFNRLILVFPSLTMSLFAMKSSRVQYLVPCVLPSLSCLPICSSDALDSSYFYTDVSHIYISCSPFLLLTYLGLPISSHWLPCALFRVFKVCKGIISYSY